MSDNKTPDEIWIDECGDLANRVNWPYDTDTKYIRADIHKKLEDDFEELAGVGMNLDLELAELKNKLEALINSYGNRYLLLTVIHTLLDELLELLKEEKGNDNK